VEPALLLLLPPLPVGLFVVGDDGASADASVDAVVRVLVVAGDAREGGGGYDGGGGGGGGGGERRRRLSRRNRAATLSSSTIAVAAAASAAPADDDVVVAVVVIVPAVAVAPVRSIVSLASPPRFVCLVVLAV